MGDIPITVFPGETVQPDDVCSRVRYYMLEGGKQQAVEAAFQDSLRLLGGNCYYFGSHASQALGIAASRILNQKGNVSVDRDGNFLIVGKELLTASASEVVLRYAQATW